MICPVCESKSTRVEDSRATAEGRERRRRYSCDKCKHRFTTREAIGLVSMARLREYEARLVRLRALVVDLNDDVATMLANGTDE